MSNLYRKHSNNPLNDGGPIFPIILGLIILAIVLFYFKDSYAGNLQPTGMGTSSSIVR